MVFVVRYSEDGVCRNVYTNVKALYNSILESGYKPTTIECGSAFCLSNLKAESQFQREFTIDCENGSEIYVTRCEVLTK